MSLSTRRCLVAAALFLVAAVSTTTTTCAFSVRNNVGVERGRSRHGSGVRSAFPKATTTALARQSSLPPLSALYSAPTAMAPTAVTNSSDTDNRRRIDEESGGSTAAAADPSSPVSPQQQQQQQQWQTQQSQQKTQELPSPRSASDLTQQLKLAYMALEHPGPTYRRMSPTLRFSYVSPPCPVEGTSTWRKHTQQREDDTTTSTAEIARPHYDPDPDKPIAVYVPGLDGYGVSAFQWQFDDLARTFELWRLVVQAEDRSSLHQVVKAVSDFVETIAEEHGGNKSVVLIGESCGGMLVAAAALQLLNRNSKKRNTDKIDLKGVVLVNPATCFDQTVWDRVVPVLTSLKYLEGNNKNSLTPYSVVGSLLLGSIVPDGDQVRRIVETFANLPDVNIVPTNLEQLRDITRATSESFRETEFRLPPDVLKHRVGWLTSGASVVNARLNRLDVPTLVVAGTEDRLLPSTKEADRLLEVLPNAEKLSVRGRGHFVLDENVNLTEAILYSNIDPYGWKNSKKKFDCVLDWEPPSELEREKLLERNVKPFRSAFSPVFFSADQAGKRWKGLGKIPRPDGPILFVANHQFAALDLRILVAELVEKRGIFPRGLAHPVTFFASKDNPGELGGRTPGLIDPNPINGDFRIFGAIEVNPRNFYRVLQAGQDALLFPGGAKEALSTREDYPLFWPNKTDFVRTAAKFNATVIPVSAVGCLER